MRRPTPSLITALPLLVALLVTPALLAAAEVTYLVRPVEIKREGSDRWEVLNLGDEVRAGDTIRTGFGARVEVTISKKRVFRIGQVTEIELPELRDDEKSGIRAKFNLLLGRFWAGLIRPIRDLERERFEVATATAVVGVKGTQFGVDYDKVTKESQVLVIDGQVAVAPPPEEVRAPVEIAGPREVAPPQEISRAKWLVLVSRDQKVIIRPDEVPQVEPLTDEDKADPWVVFNLERDQILAQAP